LRVTKPEGKAVSLLKHPNMYDMPLSVALCVLGTFAVSLLVDAILSRRTAKIDMVSALKSIE